MSFQQLILIISYSVFLLFLTFCGIRGKTNFSLRSLVIFSIIIHLLISFSFIGLVHYDTISYKLIGTLTLQGKTLYPADAYYHYPYFPGFNYIEALSVFLSQSGFPYMLFLKLFFSIFDVANLVLIYFLAKKNMQAAFLYAVNPSLIFLSSAHGQLEAIPFFFSLLAVYLYRQHREFVTSLALGFAFLAKVWPLLFLPYFLKYSKKRYLYVFSVAVPALSILFYAKVFHTPVPEIIRPLLSYRGGYGSWGISTLVHFFLPADQGLNNAIYKSVTNITVVLLTLLMLIRKRTDLLKEMFVFLLIFSAVSLSGANPVWLIPFILIFQPPDWKLWLITVSIYGAVSISGEVARTALPVAEQAFVTLGFFTAVFLWLTNIVMIFNYIISTKDFIRPLRAEKI